MNLVKIVVQVPESEVQNLKVGMPVGIHVQASNIGANGKSCAGTIHKIVPAADPMSRQFEMQVLTENPDHRIKSGMFARISVGKSGKSTLVVPGQAVFQRGQLEGLYVVACEIKARLRWIRTGRKYNHLIEIISGLNPGERVVVEGRVGRRQPGIQRAGHSGAGGSPFGPLGCPQRSPDLQFATAQPGAPSR